MNETLTRLPDMDYPTLAPKVYEEVVKQHPESAVKLVAKQGEIMPVIIRALELIDTLEKVAYMPTLDPPPKAFWLITASGTSETPLKETDPAVYQDPERPWFNWMQRLRIGYTEWLVRRSTENITGEDLSGLRFTPKLKQAVGENGPWVIINGNEIENDDFRKVVQQEDTGFSLDRLHAIELNPESTIGQVLTFSLPKGIDWQSGDRIGIVCSAPQMVRLLHMMRYEKNGFKNKIPEGVKIQLFPMPTPAAGRESYAIQELAGLLWYIFRDNNPVAAKKPYPFVALD